MLAAPKIVFMEKAGRNWKATTRDPTSAGFTIERSCCTASS